METSGTIKKRLDKVLADVEWNDVLSLDFLIDKLYILVLFVVVMAVFHFAGRVVADNIDNGILRDKEDRTKRAAVAGSGDGTQSYRVDSRRLISSLTGTFAYAFLMIVGLFVVLAIVGVDLSTILTIVLVLLVVFGFLIHGTLKDATAGAVLALFQTYDEGDIIRIDNRDGKVLDFRFINTLLQELETSTLITVPNSVVQSAIVTNYSRTTYHTFQFAVRMSNTNNDSYAGVVDLIREDLRDVKKYPDLFRDATEPDVGIGDISQPASLLIVNVPMTASMDMLRKRLRIITSVRETLAKNDVKLWPAR